MLAQATSSTTRRRRQQSPERGGDRADGVVLQRERRRDDPVVALRGRHGLQRQRQLVDSGAQRVAIGDPVLPARDAVVGTGRRSDAGNGSRIHMSTGASGKTNDAGMTPTTVVGTPSSVTARPTNGQIRAVAPAHKPCERTADWRGAVHLSLGSHVPIAGCCGAPGERRRRARDTDALGSALPPTVDPRRAGYSDALERARLLANGSYRRAVIELNPGRGCSVRGMPKSSMTSRLGPGNGRVHHHALDDREDRDVGADGERKRQDRRRGEGRRRLRRRTPGAAPRAGFDQWNCCWSRYRSFVISTPPRVRSAVRRASSGVIPARTLSSMCV